MGIFSGILRALPGHKTMNEAALRVNTYRRLAGMTELQSPSLAEHGRRVAAYSKQIAELMGLPGEEVSRIGLAAELRDIGYLHLPPALLSDYAELSRAEAERIRRHPVLGADMLVNVEGLRDLVPLIKYHHERYDGSGYPEQLKGDEIPLGARIIAVADVFDAVTSRRPHRNAYATADAVDHLSQEAGRLYDPEVVEVFISQWRQSSIDDLEGRPRVLEIRRAVPASTPVSRLTPILPVASSDSAV